MANNRKKKALEEITVPKMESGEHLMEILNLKKENVNLREQLEAFKSECIKLQNNLEDEYRKYNLLNASDYKKGKELIAIKGKWWFKLFS